MNYILNAYALQDVGQRTNQEDSFYPPFIDPCHYDEIKHSWCFYDGTPHTDDRLFIVCDGMGGHDRGEVASQTVTMTMSHSLLRSSSLEGEFKDETLREAVDEALNALAAQDDPREVKKMGTTMTVLKFHAEGATVGHIGDSRVYHFRPASKSEPAKIMFRTEDHSVVNDMVQCGQLTPEQALTSPNRHLLSRSMTSAPDYHPEVDIHHITDIRPGDVFMLCTDGLLEQHTDEELCQLLTDPNFNDVERVQHILHETRDNKDNHTAMVIRVEDILNVTGSNTHDSLLPGTVLKSEHYTYHIEKELGHGAFGITYLVNTNISMQGQLGTIHTGVKVALKEFFMHGEMKRENGMLTSIAPDSKVKQYADKFRREAMKLAMLSHPNIVRVLEVFEANDTIYYSMEYLPDGSLGDYVRQRGGLPEQEALGYIRRIGSALLYLHTNKMLHLDVKPANIMRVASTNSLKLIDFGLAKRYESNGEAESSAHLGVGTTGYAPLEQADGETESEFAPQIDVYALGATYYKILTGQTPDRAVEVLNRGLNTYPLVKKKVTQQSINAIKAAMQPTKAKRLKSVAEFLDMLPRVDDQVLFPQKKNRDIWPWVTLAACAAVIFSVTMWKLRDRSAYDDEHANEVSVVDDHYYIPTVKVEGGTFIMGSDAGEADELPKRRVTVSTFYIGQFEVTQSQWRAVMQNVKMSKSKNANYPVFNVTWDQIQTFITRLNKKTGRNYRLPTEAEWEYAARGGKAGIAKENGNAGGIADVNSPVRSMYSGSTSIDPVAWYQSNGGRRPHPTGSKKPNALGIYDMSGNVWEYCSDWYGTYEGKSATNPKGPKEGDCHVIRGGSFNSSENQCRTTYRQDDSMISPTPDIGFRLVEVRK